MHLLRCKLFSLCVTCFVAAHAPRSSVHGLSPMPNEIIETTVTNNGFAIERSTQASGCVLHASGDDFELSGTVGQFDAGRMAGGHFELTGGFWFELIAGDCGEDGGISVGDVPHFTACLTGPSAPADVACWCGDFDGDADTDLRDVAEFQNEYVAP